MLCCDQVLRYSVAAVKLSLMRQPGHPYGARQKCIVCGSPLDLIYILYTFVLFACVEACELRSWSEEA